MEDVTDLFIAKYEDMKRKNLINLIITCLLIMGSGCSKEEISTWQSDNGLVWFTKVETDFSFKSVPEISEGESYMVPVQLSAAAAMSNKDRIIQVMVSKQPTDSRTQFEIQTPIVFRAGHTVDTMYVRVVNSAHLSSVHDTISFTVLDSSDFKPGLLTNRTANLCLYNGYVQPDWWNDDVDRSLGYFSELKMEVLIAVTGSEKLPVSDWYGIEATYLIFKLNDYVKQNDIRYPADDPNKPGEQPSFDFWSY